MSPVLVALDVGGTSIKSALYSAGLEPLHEQRQPTPAADGPRAVIDALTGIADRLVELARAEQLTPAAIGLAVPGAVDEARGIASRAVNLGWSRVPLRQLVAEHTGLPVRIGHDVRAAALAEARMSDDSAAGDSLLFVALGTGVGAALLDGARTGHSSWACELGHILVRAGRSCPCGRIGCLETVASASAIARRYAARGGDRVDAATIAARARSGEKLACTILADAAEALAEGLATVVTLLNPTRVVLGGGLAQAGDVLLTPVRTALTARFHAAPPPPVTRSVLGERAGCAGAALLASQLLEAAQQCS